MSQVPARPKVAILRVMREAGGTAGSGRIARDIQAFGIELSPRSIRLYLEALASEGLVTPARRGRDGGRAITARGLGEIADALVLDRIGFTAAKADTLAWRMTFDLERQRGLVVLNLSLLPAAALAAAFAAMAPVFAAGLGMGDRLAFFRAGEMAGTRAVPAGQVALGTVCSVTLNGVLLSHRIPVTSRFGGVLELVGGEPVRFTDAISYDGTSLDPLEIFIRGGLTRVRPAAATGHGRIGASFREVPSCAVNAVQTICRRMAEIGLGQRVVVGKPNQPLLGFPVPEGRTGLIVTGGLNPLAAVAEAGIPTENCALWQLFEFERLRPYPALAAELGVPLPSGAVGG